MASKKKRSFQQMMEEDSFSVIRDKLPKEWVLHDYRPDYGIDLVVELFEFVDSSKKIAETLGEHIYVQVKSIQNAKIETIRVFQRTNVEKSAPDYDKSKYFDIEVIKFVLNTSELLTIQSMGAAVPVLLFLVDLKDNELYYLCLNDYIDKILLHEDPEYGKKQSKTLLIPKKNKINHNDGDTLIPIQFYAKRAKLYSAFTKFYYQRNELTYNHSPDLILHFINIIKKYDFWSKTHMWIPIQEMYNEIIAIERYFSDLKPDEKHSLPVEEFVQMKVIPEWDRLCNLSNMYEELCREWFLPTYLAQLLSYQRIPEENGS
ncbi:DUF4365 domain-containing protein [Desulfonauticus submarinus]